MTERNRERERAVALTRAAIRQAAVEAFGATETHEPLAGYRVLTRQVLDDPLAGVRAALLAHRVAFGQMREFAEFARAAGCSWDEIATALEIPADDEWEPAGSRAFEWLTEGTDPDRDDDRSWRLQRRASAWWTCAACGGRVIDRGPYESHPDDNETGHEPDCARRLAAVRAHERERGDLR